MVVMTLNITMNADGTVSPFGLKWLRDSSFELLAPTRDSFETVEGVDGVVDFGSEFGTGEFTLELINNNGFLSQSAKNSLRDTVVGYLNQLRDYGTLTWENDSGKTLSVRLQGKPQMPDIPGRVKVSIPLAYQPIWVSVEEHSHTDDGTLVNAGTFETPIVVEIRGPCSNPSVIVGDYTLSYTGDLISSDTLIIDTGALTAKFNSVNALGNLTGLSHEVKLQPGNTAVTGASGGTTVFKWYDGWL